MATSPSLRDLAKALGLSHTTISEALRGTPRVKPETRDRILAAAKAAGYRSNPLAGALMSEMRRARGGTFRGVLAILDLDGPEGRPVSATRYHAELERGVRERADQLGFKGELFALGQRGVSLPRLDTILRSRGIRGLVFLPVDAQPDLTALDWSHYAGVYTDYVIAKPRLHCVCSDHYLAMFTAMERLAALGYRRPGLVISRHQDERLLYRWEAGFTARREHYPDFARIKPLVPVDVTREAFTKWFKETKPDVVLCHRAEVIEWMQECGARVPETHGFCCLNQTMNPRSCAGVDLQPRLLGARAVELLIAQIYHNEYGVPPTASITSIPAVWTDGPTLRAMPPVPTKS